MSITEADRAKFQRALDRIQRSDLDGWTKDSAIDALTISRAALESAPEDRQADAQANAALAITLALFASAAPGYSVAAAREAVDAQVVVCNANRKKPTFGVLSKLTMPVAIIIGAVILRADDQLFARIVSMFFGG